MTISVGDLFPGETVKTWDDAPVDLAVGDLILARRLCFRRAGALPTRSMRHMPGFVDHYDDIKAKGVDVIAVHRSTILT